MTRPTDLELSEQRTMCLASVLAASRAFHSEAGLPSSAEMSAITTGLGIDEMTDTHAIRLIGMLLGVAASLCVGLDGEDHLIGLLAEANRRTEVIRMGADISQEDEDDR